MGIMSQGIGRNWEERYKNDNTLKVYFPDMKVLEAVKMVAEYSVKGAMSIKLCYDGMVEEF